MTPLGPAYGAITLCGIVFQLISAGFGLSDQVDTLQLPNGYPRGIRRGLFPLHSQLLGESPLISFPSPNDMLKFGE